MKKISWCLAFLFAVSCLLAAQAGAPAAEKEKQKDDWQPQLRKYSRIYAAIKKFYPKPIDKEKLFFASISGLLKELDPHSYFLDPLSLRSMSEDQEGNYHGIGTRITKYEDRLTVIAPLKDTPAYRLGIMAGDVIVTIDGKPTKEMTLDDAMNKLRGAKGTTVNIEIMREGLDAPLPFSIKRQEIPLESISFGVMHPDAKGIGYISIRTFGNTTAEELKKKMETLTAQQGLKALILDLRGNAGGSLYAAIDVADCFLPKGKVIVSIKGRTMKQNFVAREDNQYEDIPMAVLINRGSASASEIVASAMQDHDRADILGVRSWGKGLVQTVHKLSLNSSMALTTAKYYTPDNKCLQRDFSKLDDYMFVMNTGDYDNDESVEGGVMPDYKVESGVYPVPIVRLISKGVFFRFARDLIDGGYPIKKDFKADKTVIKKFKAFLKKNKIKHDTAIFDKHITTVKYEIEKDALSNKFSAAVGLNVFLRADPVSNKAVELLTAELDETKKENQEDNK